MPVSISKVGGFVESHAKEDGFLVLRGLHGFIATFVCVVMASVLVDDFAI